MRLVGLCENSDIIVQLDAIFGAKPLTKSGQALAFGEGNTARGFALAPEQVFRGISGGADFFAKVFRVCDYRFLYQSKALVAKLFL